MEEDGERQHVDHDRAHLVGVAVASIAMVSGAAAVDHGRAHHAVVGVGRRHEDPQQVIAVDVVGE